MKELLQKKTIKIGIAVIILAVAIGIISINVRSAQRQREYDGHVDAAEKYLTELDYEQAIVEYTLALEIEPNNEEVLNALEQTYLDYAQSLADAGDYEKAVSVLEDGYAQTGRESLREKMEELKSIQEQIVELPFEPTDITIKGYDLFDDYYEELCAAYGVSPDTDMSRGGPSDVETIYGEVGTSYVEEDSQKYISIIQSWELNDDGNMLALAHADYWVTTHSNFLVCAEGEKPLDLSVLEINLPIKPGDSYEEWCQIMQVPKIKETTPIDLGSGWNPMWFVRTKYGYGEYWEDLDKTSCGFELLDGDNQLLFSLSIHLREDLSISEVQVSAYPGSF